MPAAARAFPGHRSTTAQMLQPRQPSQPGKVVLYYNRFDVALRHLLARQVTVFNSIPWRDWLVEYLVRRNCDHELLDVPVPSEERYALARRLEAFPTAWNQVDDRQLHTDDSRIKRQTCLHRFEYTLLRAPQERNDSGAIFGPCLLDQDLFLAGEVILDKGLAPALDQFQIASDVSAVRRDGTQPPSSPMAQ